MNKQELLDSLLSFGINTCTVFYRVHDDKAHIYNVEANTEIPDWLLHELDVYVYAYIPAGWELNHGSEGIVTFDTNTRTVTMKNNQSAKVIIY